MIVEKEVSRAKNLYKKYEHRTGVNNSNINITLPESLLTKINKVAYDNDVSRSLFIRAAVRYFLNEGGEK